MDVLSVTNLCKTYPHFQLDHVSFSLKKGRIMGFIGRNGAGKTTTLKSLLNFVHPDGGDIRFFGLDFPGNELEIKRRIGFVSGGIDYYQKKKLRTITDVTRRFYSRWDEAAYQRYMAQFSLPNTKTPAELSAGMRVKYALTLALSHGAEILILDEPSSGLDPVSRDELLRIFLDLADMGITILFSTHIISDLDKCADDITYIKNGRILASTDISSFAGGYRMLELDGSQITDALRPRLIGCSRTKNGYSALIRTADAAEIGLPSHTADLEDIMVHIEREDMQ